MIIDNTVSVAPEVVKQLISNLRNKHYPAMERSLAAILKKWKGSNNFTDVTYIIINGFISISKYIRR
jgi:penicillin amidase